MAINLFDGWVNQEDNAMELLQDLSLKALLKHEQGYFDGKKENEIGGILNRSLKNLWVDKIRAKKNDPKIYLYSEEMDSEVENDVWCKLLKDEINDQLQLMPSKNHSDSFKLRLEGYGITEIAKMTGRDPNEVNQYIIRARKKLKQHLAA